MSAEKLPQRLRERLNVLFKWVIALNKVNLGNSLVYNRVSGAVYRQLLAPANARLSEDEAVDLAVELTTKENLPRILDEYDQCLQKREEQARKQRRGIVNNKIPQDLPNREQVVEDTLAMLDKFPCARSITGICKLVQLRIENGHVDINETDHMYTE